VGGPTNPLRGASAPRVAIVHDWLYVLGGAERVLAAMHRCYPTADVFCLFDVLDEQDHRALGFDACITSFLQHMPFIRRLRRLYLPLMPLAVEQLDLSGYDLVLSNSSAVAKGILTGPDQLHISYVHSPMRYAWDQQNRYLEGIQLKKGFRSMLARLLLHRMRIWDQRTAHGVDAYLTNSHFMARRIHKVYGCDATVIYPPVDVRRNWSPSQREGFFLTASDMVARSNVRAIVDAFRALPEDQLVVVGDGPQAAALRRVAPANVTFAGDLEYPRLRELMASARAFIWAAEEDFSLAPLEAQAEGAPVIVLGKGGARETIVGSGPGNTGLFFDLPTPAAIAAAVREFIDRENEFEPEECHRNAARFSHERFIRELTGFIASQMRGFHANLDEADARPLLFRTA
jgi:glycosyltransferase involved in cell wall biosynthesis